jgi:flagellin
MTINTNISAEISATNLSNSTSMLNQSLARLSSGSKIVSAADDPAGLAESIQLNSAIGRTSAANANVSNANSFSQTQDGFLQKIGDALNRMSELAISAQDVTKSSSELTDYNAEFTALAGYITNTGTQSFNGVSLFAGNSLAVTTDGNGGTYSMTSVSLSVSAYTSATGSGISTSAAAITALADVEAAITQLATDRANVGANESRMTYTGDQLSVLQNNLSAANSQITDVDVAQESTNYAKYQILVQAGTSMLAQANQNPQSILKLLA